MDAKKNKARNRHKLDRALYSANKRVVNADATDSNGNYHCDKASRGNIQRKGGGLMPEAGRGPSPMQLTSVTYGYDEDYDEDGNFVTSNQRVVSLTKLGVSEPSKKTDLRYKMNEINAKRLAADNLSDNQGRVRHPRDPPLRKSASPAAVGVPEEGKIDLRNKIQTVRRISRESNESKDSDSVESAGRTVGSTSARPRLSGGGGGRMFRESVGLLTRMGLPFANAGAVEVRSPPKPAPDESDPRLTIKTTSPENFTKIEDDPDKEMDNRRRKVESAGGRSPVAASIKLLASGGLMTKKYAEDGGGKNIATGAGRRIRRPGKIAVTNATHSTRDDYHGGEEGADGRRNGDFIDDIESVFDEDGVTDADHQLVARRMAAAESTLPVKARYSSSSDSRSVIVGDAEPQQQQQPTRRFAFQQQVEEYSQETTSSAGPPEGGDIGEEDVDNEAAALVEEEEKAKKKRRKKEKKKRKLETDEFNPQAQDTRKARVIDLQQEVDQQYYETGEAVIQREELEDAQALAASNKVVRRNRAVVIVEGPSSAYGRDAEVVEEQRDYDGLPTSSDAGSLVPRSADDDAQDDAVIAANQLARRFQREETGADSKPVLNRDKREFSSEEDVKLKPRNKKASPFSSRDVRPASEKVVVVEQGSASNEYEDEAAPSAAMKQRPKLAVMSGLESKQPLKLTATTPVGLTEERQKPTAPQNNRKQRLNEAASSQDEQEAQRKSIAAPDVGKKETRSLPKTSKYEAKPKPLVSDKKPQAAEIELMPLQEQIAAPKEEPKKAKKLTKSSKCTETKPNSASSATEARIKAETTARGEAEKATKTPRELITAPESEKGSEPRKLAKSKKVEKFERTRTSVDDKKRVKETRKDGNSGKKSNENARQEVDSKRHRLEDAGGRAERNAASSSQTPVDRGDARKVLNRKSATPRRHEKDDDAARRSKKRRSRSNSRSSSASSTSSSSSSSSSSSRCRSGNRGHSNSRRSSPDRRTPSSSKRRRQPSTSSSSYSSSPSSSPSPHRQRRRSSRQHHRSPSPKRRSSPPPSSSRSSSSRRVRRRSSSSRRRRHHHRRRSSDSRDSSRSPTPRPRSAASKSEAPRTSSSAKPVGIATLITQRPSTSDASLATPPMAGPPAPPPGLFTNTQSNIQNMTQQRNSFGQQQQPQQFSPVSFPTPSPVSARRDHQHRGGDASFEFSQINRSLFSTPPPPLPSTSAPANSVASAREEFRRSSHSVDHPFTRLMTSGGDGSIPVVDSHAHIDFLFDKIGYRGTFEKFCQENPRFTSPNFGGIVANFCDPKTSNDLEYRKWNSVVNMPSGHPIKVWQSWSCHPTKANLFNSNVENFLKKIVNDPNVVAVGEAGLDYSRLPAHADQVLEQQRVALAAQCRIAVAAKKPLVIHVRDVNNQKTTVHQDTINILRENVPDDQLIHCHCFTGGVDEYNLWKKNLPNTYFGLTNMVSYNWARDTHNLAAQIPLDRLLLETDAPFMTPRCLPHGVGKVCYPGMALCVASSVHDLRHDGASITEILRRTSSNVARVYQLPPL